MDPVSNTCIVNTERIILIKSNQSFLLSSFTVQFWFTLNSSTNRIDNLIRKTPSDFNFPSRQIQKLQIFPREKLQIELEEIKNT